MVSKTARETTQAEAEQAKAEVENPAQPSTRPTNWVRSAETFLALLKSTPITPQPVAQKDQTGLQQADAWLGHQLRRGWRP